jgi:hypothetical protein
MPDEYFVMECGSEPGQEEAMIAEWPRIPGVDSWWTGAPLALAEGSEVRCVLHPEYTAGLLPMFNDEILLMTRSLVDCLQSTGIDNLQCFPALIVNPSNEQQHRDYLAVNVLGVVRVADLGRSRVPPASSHALIAMDFDALAIDTAAARGLPFFRLAESVNALIAHDRVRRAVMQNSSFNQVRFVPPMEWLG